MRGGWVMICGERGSANVQCHGVGDLKSGSNFGSQCDWYAHGGGGCFSESVGHSISVAVNAGDWNTRAGCHDADVVYCGVRGHPRDSVTVCRIVKHVEDQPPYPRQWPAGGKRPRFTLTTGFEAVQTVSDETAAWRSGSSRHQERPRLGAIDAFDPAGRHSASSGDCVSFLVDGHKRPSQPGATREIRVNERSIGIVFGANGLLRGSSVPFASTILGDVRQRNIGKGDESFGDGTRRSNPPPCRVKGRISNGLLAMSR